MKSKIVYLGNINTQILLNENASLKAKIKMLEAELFEKRMDHSVLMDFTLPHLHELIRIKSQPDHKIPAHDLIKNCLLAQGWNIARILSGQNRAYLKLVCDETAIMVHVNLNGSRSWTSEASTIFKITPCQR